MEPILVTERLALYPVTPADIDDLTELDSDPEVMQFIDRDPTQRAVIESQVEEIIAEYERTPGLGQWAARHRDAPEFLGWFALRRGDAAGHGTLGYRLRRSAWGRGYASEGSRALIDYGFTNHRLDRITADTMAVNERSRRVMTNVGMTYLRTYHEHFDDPLPGTDQGEVEYQITRSEWLARK